VIVSGWGGCDRAEMNGERSTIVAEDKEKNKCKNAACSCTVQEGQKYCSASCEGTGDTIEIDCDCSHPECKGNF